MQEHVNNASDIANMDEANQRGVQELDSKGLIDTVGGDQEQEHLITVKGLVATVTTNQSLFLEEKHKK